MFTGLFARLALGDVFARVPWQIWAALGLVVVVGVGVWQIDSRAYNRGFAASDAQWQERLDAELERQDDANRTALRLAQEQIQRLQEAKDVRDATIARLTQEAASDPDAARPSVSAGGVRRLNSVLD